MYYQKLSCSFETQLGQSYKIFFFFRYPSYIYCAKLLYGYIAEVLIEELLHLGQALHKSLIDRVMAKINKAVSGKR